jgi:NAD(P)-dependent dehydrogenase (short-subunit alcohol dehydrogenase family)
MTADGSGLLRDQVIFLTGGSAGIGLECARAYAEQQARVVVVARSSDAVNEAVAQLPGEDHLGIPCDVSDDAQVRAAIQTTLEHYGRLTAVHNNAGTAAPSKPLHETSDAEWDALFDINLRSVLLTTRHAFAALRDSRGSILNTSSLVGVIGQELHAGYTATKGAMNTLTKSMALDYAPLGIRVNAVLPAGVWTPMLRRWCAEQPDPGSIEQYLNDIHPLGYCPDSDAIADACVYLLSPMARFVTGHLLHVSGGAELGYRRITRSAPPELA